MKDVVAGVYEVICRTTGRRYIGSAVNIAKRQSYHRWQLRAGRHHSVVLQRAWDKYGEQAFDFRTLLVCAAENLLFYEQRAIDSLCPVFNMLPKAGSVLGLRWSEESKARHRQTWREKVAPQLDYSEHRRKVQAAWAAGKYTAGMRAKSNLYEHEGQTYTVAEAAIKFGINMNTLKYRLLHGMPFKQAVSQAVAPTYGPRAAQINLG